jgi:hypothetical protein
VKARLRKQALCRSPNLAILEQLKEEGALIAPFSFWAFRACPLHPSAGKIDTKLHFRRPGNETSSVDPCPLLRYYRDTLIYLVIYSAD